MAEVQQQQAEPAERVEEDRDRDRVQKEQEEEEEETVTTLSMIGTSATTEGGSFRTNPEELIRYEDQHVKLTDTELLLKTYYNNDNGHNSVTILLSHIVHVCWAGSDDQKKKKKPSLLTKFKKKSKKSKTKKQKPTGKKIGNDDDDDDIANEEAEAEDKKKKEHHKKQNNKISKRFVVVASTKGSQQTTGYGFSVLEDPLLFHKLIQPSHYVAIEKKAKAKADAKAAADDRKNATPRESVIAVASSAGQFIRNLSKDNLSSLMGGGGDDNIKGSTANKNDKEIMASGTLGSAISTGELQSLLAGYHIDDVEEAEDNEEDGAPNDEEEDEETTEVATVDGIVGVVSYPSLHEQNRYHSNTAECHFEEQHDDRPLPPRD